MRLLILTTLAENDSSPVEVMASYIMWCFPISRDQLDGHLIWLDEQGLIELDEKNFMQSIIRSTMRGTDVAAGRAFYPGVMPPLGKLKA